MNQEPDEARASRGSRLERAIVLQLLSEEREHRCTRAKLATVLAAETAEVEKALGALRGHGVLCLAEHEVRASPATRRLEELGLIAV